MDIINEIRSNLKDYSDADFKVLQGRLTLNAYGADVSDALADEVIAERKRRAYLAHKAAQQAEAEAFMAEHAADLYEKQDRDERVMVYGAEYFAQSDDGVIDFDVADDDIDSVSAIEYHGIYNVENMTAHKPNAQLVETACDTKEADSLNPHYTPRTDHIAIEGFDVMTPAGAPSGLSAETYMAPKRWTEKQTNALAKHHAATAKARRYFGIDDIVGTKTQAAKVSRAAQYADAQSKAQRAAKRQSKLARRLASKM